MNISNCDYFLDLRENTFFIVRRLCGCVWADAWDEADLCWPLHGQCGAWVRGGAGGSSGTSAASGRNSQRNAKTSKRLFGKSERFTLT